MSKMGDLINAVKQDSYLPPVITPLHNQWLAAGAHYTEEAVEIITAQMRKDWLDGTVRSDGSGRVRPSMVGGCLRKQRMSYLGMPSRLPDVRSQAFFATGHFGHYKWQLSGLSAGWLKQIEVQIRTEYELAGSADGKCFDGSVFELKTTNTPNLTKVRSANYPLPGHELQTAGYADAFGTRFVSIIYEGREWLDFHEVRFEVTDELLDKMRELCDVVTDMDTDIRPLQVCLSGSGQTYTNCDFSAACHPMDYA